MKKLNEVEEEEQIFKRNDNDDKDGDVESKENTVPRGGGIRETKRRYK